MGSDREQLLDHPAVARVVPDNSDDGLHVAGVHKRFGRKPVLVGADLVVPAGTVAAVLGPSGCGKTTLLRIIAGFEVPDRGTVRLAGRALVGGGAPVPSQRRRIGLMPQEGALFPHLTVGGNVAFGLRQRYDRRTAVEQWLDIVGLAGAIDQRPHELSGGQQQRVALARALAADPQALLLDEPFAALDAGLRTRVREEIACILRDAGTTAVLVTHDQAEALSLADVVAVMLDGTVVQSGTPHEVYERPVSLAAARFVGAAVELTGEATGGVTDTVMGRLPSRVPVADGPVTVVLRPEQLWLHPEAGVTATVVTQRFYGPDGTVSVRLADGTPLVLRYRGAGVRMTPGDAVSVMVAGDVLAYAR